VYNIQKVVKGIYVKYLFLFGLSISYLLSAGKAYQIVLVTFAEKENANAYYSKHLKKINKILSNSPYRFHKKHTSKYTLMTIGLFQKKKNAMIVSGMLEKDYKDNYVSFAVKKK